MRTFAAATLLLAACSGPAEGPAEQANGAGDAAAPPANLQNQAAPTAGARWEIQSSSEGSALVLLSSSGEATLRLVCPAGARRLLVNVPGFRPVASEERLSFGIGEEVVALVADFRGDAVHGGVTGTGEVPVSLFRLIAPISVNYGAQNSGPHPAPPPDLAFAFPAACAAGRARDRQEPEATAGLSPCLIQGGQRLEVTPMRAVGTEPFWGARIEGRCVTYSHPEDQAGTRIWTAYTLTSHSKIWFGALDGQRFELTIRAAPGCSDGMSDRRYPLAVELLVGGERRRGCAAPL